MCLSHSLWRKMPELSILSTFISLFSQYVLSGRLLQNRHCKFCGCQNKILRVHSSLSEDERAQRMESPCCVFNRHLRNKSSSILKCASAAHALRIPRFVCTVKFTEHEHLKPSAHLKAFDGSKHHEHCKQNYQGGQRCLEGMEESWWNERKPFGREQPVGWQMTRGRSSSCTKHNSITSTGVFPQHMWELGLRVIPRPPRGQLTSLCVSNCRWGNRLQPLPFCLNYQ